MSQSRLSIQAVLWDMDGVLVDSADLHFESWTHTLQDYGLVYTRQHFIDTFGMNNESILKLLLGGDSNPTLRQEISDRKEVLFRQMVPGRVEPLPGARDWLERFQQAGLRQAVASSGPPENLAVLTAAMGLNGYFSSLVSAFSMPGKPDPAVFLEAARQVGVAPAQALVIEDGLPGVEAAHRAGMRCLAVATTHPVERLSQAGLVTSSLAALTWDELMPLIGPGFTRLDTDGSL